MFVVNYYPSMWIAVIVIAVVVVVVISVVDGNHSP